MRYSTAAIVAIAAASLSTLDARQQAGTTNPTAQTPLTAAPRRTEAEARAAADRNRRERDLQRQKTGAPVELVSNYIKAQILPVPASLGVNPFYTKYVDAQGIPVISSDKVPDDALLVARDIVNSMLARRPDLRAAMIKRRWRTGVIAEVEMTMDIPEYSRMKRPGAPRDEPGRPLLRRGHPERGPRCPDPLLGPADPLRDRRLGDQEGAGDLGRGQPTDGAQRQRHLRGFGQRGMAAQQQQGQRVIDPGNRQGFGRSPGRDRLLAPVPSRLVAPQFDQPPRGGRDQPTLRIVRQPLDRPLQRRGQQRLLHRVLTGVELPVPADQQREHLRGQLAQSLLGRRYRIHAISFHPT